MKFIYLGLFLIHIFQLQGGYDIVALEIELDLFDTLGDNGFNKVNSLKIFVVLDK